MGNLKRYPQRFYLFFYYGGFILCLISIFFGYFYYNYSRNTYLDSQKQAQNLSASIHNSLLSELNNLSTISLNIVYSNVIRSNFKEFSSSYSRTRLSAEDFSTSRNSSLAIYDAIISIIGPFQSASQINLYTLTGEYVGSGFHQSVGAVNLSERIWYQPTVSLSGAKYISGPVHIPHFPGEGENQSSQMFMVMTRQMNNQASHADGYVEVIQDCNKLFSLSDQLKNSNPQTEILIYNDRKELVYPYHSGKMPKKEYLSLINRPDILARNSQMITLESRQQVLFTYEYINSYGWAIILITPRESVYSSLHNFRNTFLGLALLTILSTLFLCFMISRKLTKPLSELTKETHKITINQVLDDNPPILEFSDSGIMEISQLCESIQNMYEELKYSSQKVLRAHSEETRAKLQASQSLINPHFLYNSLTTIAIMAEEEMNEDIVFMCNSLCDYYRYISRSREMIVTLNDEILFTQKYIDCMKIRFGSDFEYYDNISEETKNILIPKLIIQPIVENAFKYAFTKAPPWQLTITSKIENQNWMIMIEDNGGLLDDQKRSELLETYQRLNDDNGLISLKIGGLGLKNIYLRLLLLYSDQAIFDINNSQPGKTIFIIGGPIYRTLEDYYAHHTKI